MTRPLLVFRGKEARQRWAEVSDGELLAGVAARDEDALDELVKRKTEPLVRVAYRILGDLEEARDVVQVTFLRLWEHGDRYDARWSPNTWIYRIATNLAIDQLRSRRSRERSAEPLRWHLRAVGDAQSGRLDEVQEREVMEIFGRLAAELSEKQRAVFLLREVEGMASDEVAAILGCRESTVRNHLFNARKTLRRTLRERYPEYASAAGAGEDR